MGSNSVTTSPLLSSDLFFDCFPLIYAEAHISVDLSCFCFQVLRSASLTLLKQGFAATGAHDQGVTSNYEASFHPTYSCQSFSSHLNSSKTVFTRRQRRESCPITSFGEQTTARQHPVNTITSDYQPNTPVVAQKHKKVPDVNKQDGERIRHNPRARHLHPRSPSRTSHRAFPSIQDQIQTSFPPLDLNPSLLTHKSLHNPRKAL